MVSVMVDPSSSEIHREESRPRISGTKRPPESARLADIVQRVAQQLRCMRVIVACAVRCPALI